MDRDDKIEQVLIGKIAVFHIDPHKIVSRKACDPANRNIVQIQMCADGFFTVGYFFFQRAFYHFRTHALHLFL